MPDRREARRHDGRIRVAAASTSILLLELALIRQIPAEVHAISYFTNLVLMATFFGLGLGCILAYRVRLHGTVAIGLFVVSALIATGRGVVVYPGSEEVHYWLGTETQKIATALDVPLLPAALAFFIAVAIPFIGLGQILAREMDRHARLVAYGWDLAGSLTGVLLFAAASSVEVPPWIWPPVVATVAAWLMAGGRLARLVTVAAGSVFLLFSVTAHPSKWSPYYLVQHRLEPAGVRVWVNSSFHQFGIDVRSQRPSHRRARDRMLAKWSVPYERYRDVNGSNPRRVLVLGAGTGNDVHVARSNGADEIVAVEIDPEILELGRSVNPSRPYAHPDVRTHVDDGRHFLRTTDETYDLIVFGTIDSQVLLSGHSNLRLENYLYTHEALEDARSRLRSGGMVAIYYSVFKPWLYERIFTTVYSVFGDSTEIYTTEGSRLFNTIVVAAAEPAAGFGASAEVIDDLGHGTPSTDDWPFIYLRKPGVPPLYLGLMAAVGSLILGAFVVLRRVHPVTGSHVNFLLLGIGFTLMESSAIVRLALVFGSTWVVNAVVFSAVLLTIFLANSVARTRFAPPRAWAWTALLLFVVANYATPLQSLLALEPTARTAVAAALIGLPVFFAGLCFSLLFDREPTTGYPLGVNLVGAMAGGLVEYVSMWTGTRAVWLVVFAVYALAWLATAVEDRRRWAAR